MFCSQCGFRLPEAASFCPSCGTPNVAAPVSTAPERNVPTNDVPTGQMQDVPQNLTEGNFPKDDFVKYAPQAPLKPTLNEDMPPPMPMPPPTSMPPPIPPPITTPIPTPIPTPMPDASSSQFQDVPQSPYGNDFSEYSPQMPPKPKLSKGKKVAIIAIAAAIVLLGAFAAVTAIFFPRDALIFFMGEERYTRNMFIGAIEDVSDYLIDQVYETQDFVIGTDKGEFMYSISVDAAPGAVERLIRNLNLDFFDEEIYLLELLAASSLQFNTIYDASGQSPAINFNSSWSVRSLDDGLVEEILSLESLIVGDTMYLRVQQLLDRYIGINFADLGINLADLADPSMLGTGMFGMTPIDLEGLHSFIAENESVFNAMISDSADAFFSSFDDMRVDRNVPVSVGGDTVNLHRAVITINEEDLYLALVEMLREIRNNDTYATLLFDALRIADPYFHYTMREFLEEVDYLIEYLEDEADRVSDIGEYVDIFLYIDRRNRIVGFGLEPREDDGLVSVVIVDGTGYAITVDFEEIYFRLYGTLSNDRRATSGDMHIFVRYYDFWYEEVVIEGRLLDFVYGSDFATINVSGSDILGLIYDNADPNAQTVDLLNNLALSMTTRHSDAEYTAVLTLTHLQPEISLTISAEYRPLDDVYFTAPPITEVLYLRDLPAIMDGDMAELFPLFPELTEIYNNIHDIIDNLDRMGFGVSQLFEDLIDHLFTVPYF